MIFSPIVKYAKIIGGIILALVPVLAYVFGRKDARELEQAKAAKQILRAEKRRGDFYKDMAEATHEVQNNRPTNRDDLVKRLRDSGL